MTTPLLQRLTGTLLAVATVATVSTAATLAGAGATAHAAAPWATSGIPDWNTVPAATKERPFTPPRPKRVTLKNGIKVLVVEDHDLPLIAVSVLVPGAGSASDAPGEAGLASYTADLLDEGAGTRTALEISATADRLGASLATYAGYDHAGVQLSTLARTIEPGLALLADVLTRPTFDPKEADRVRADEVTELESRKDRPREVAAIALAGALYGPGTPYGHPANGLLPDFKAFDAAKARAFYDRTWQPSRVTIVVAGDLTPKRAKELLDAALGGWKVAKSAAPKPPAIVAARPEGRFLLVDRPGAEQTDLRIGLVAVTRKDPRYAKIEVLRTILGDGFTSRLTQRLREQLGYTYGARASLDYRRGPGPFVIGTATFTPKTVDAVKEIFAIVTNLVTVDVPDAELRKARENIVRSLPAKFEGVDATAGAVGELVLYGLPDDAWATFAKAVRKVTAKDVRGVAKALLAPDKLIVVAVGDAKTIQAGLEKDVGLGAAKLLPPDGTAR